MILFLPQARDGFAWVVLMLLWGGCAAHQQVDEFQLELDPKPSTAKIQLAVSRGTPDDNNRYPAVVIVESNAAQGFPGGPGSAGSCSGVLIERDLVLTAAHCMCGQARDTAKDRVLNKSDCATRVWVKQYLLNIKVSRTGSIQDVSIKFPGVSGSAFLPDAFRMEIDDRGTIQSIRADFAVIRLDDDLNVPIQHKFPTRETQVDETVYVVGFGSTEVNGKAPSLMRHVGDNVVTGIHVVRYRENPSSDQEHLELTSDLEKKANVEEGDSGGPCFREDSSGERWLVGIINGKRPSRGERTVCLSTFRSQEVIDGLIKQARAAPKPKASSKAGVR